MNIKEINSSILNNSKMICLHKRKLMRNIFIWFITAIFISPVGLFAQKDNIRFEHLGLDEELSLDAVTCTFQDNQGFIWFGIQDIETIKQHHEGYLATSRFVLIKEMNKFLKYTEKNDCQNTC